MNDLNLWTISCSSEIFVPDQKTHKYLIKYGLVGSYLLLYLGYTLMSCVLKLSVQQNMTKYGLVGSSWLPYKVLTCNTHYVLKLVLNYEISMYYILIPKNYL